ncbi:MAG: DUF5683 domain-containing protein [Candidatus Eisenbacteria bacterium]|nr:DUF5683 domain-containing protein [Candidatus Eisenbacteria bacterium]
MALLAALLLCVLAQGSPAAVSTVDTSKAGFFGTPFFVMMRSGVIPGWGQVHNHKYLKGAGVFLLEGALAFKIYDENRKVNDYWTKHVGAATYPEQVRYFDLYAFHYDRRSNYIWWLAGTTVLSLVDAYVDAHLRGFDEEVARETAVDLAVIRRSGEAVAVVVRKTF